ncbi:MAG: dATP/dGTP pyrophosphohydrolase domain-containing protein [Thermomicrobiales bacterium]
MFYGSMTEFAVAFNALVEDHSTWSQATFGLDSERGPLGALKHLEKEAKEAQEAWSAVTLQDEMNSERMKAFRAELADCLLLLLDASRRAGVNPMRLVMDAQAKMQVNKLRVWIKPTSDVPSEHVK